MYDLDHSSHYVDSQSEDFAAAVQKRARRIQLSFSRPYFSACDLSHLSTWTMYAVLTSRVENQYNLFVLVHGTPYASRTQCFNP